VSDPVEKTSLRIVEFGSPAPKEIADMLRALLAEAERGEFTCFAFAVERADGMHRTDYVFDDKASAHKLLGIVEMFKLRIARAIFEDQDT